MAENDNTAKPGPNENLENKNESAEAEGYFKYFFNIIQNFQIEFSGVIAHPTPEPPDPNEPQPTQVPEIQLKVQTSEEQTNKFANLVQTMMVMEFNLIILYNEHYQYIGYGNLLQVVRNWLFNREEEEHKHDGDLHKQSTGTDPFLKNFAASIAESEEQPSDQSEAKTRVAKFVRYSIYAKVMSQMHYN